MTDQTIHKRLSEWNSILKENNDLYRGLAKMFGLSDCAFWIIYTLRAESAPITQKEICRYLYEPKQTVNSAIKKLEADGYLELKNLNDRRSKQLCLTEEGLELAKRTADRVIAVEQAALAKLSEQEQRAFFGFYHRYTDSLKMQFAKLPEDGQEGRHDHTVI